MIANVRARAPARSHPPSYGPPSFRTVRRIADGVCPPHCRLGFRCTPPFSPQVKKLVTIIQNPRQYRIPDWFLNRQKDVKDGKWSQCVSNGLDNKLRGKSPARPRVV